MNNVLYLTIKMLIDLEGLNCIRAHSILLVNLPNNRLVQAAVVVMVVMSCRIPEDKRSPPTTNLDVLMNISIVMVKASGEMVHPAIIHEKPHFSTSQFTVFVGLVRFSNVRIVLTVIALFVFILFVLPGTVGRLVPFLFAISWFVVRLGVSV